MATYNWAIEMGSGLVVKAGRELRTFSDRQREVMAWLDRGCKDMAINIPTEPSTWLPMLRCAPHRKQTHAPKTGHASDLISEEGITKTPPDHRNKNWPFWLMHVAQHGLYAKGQYELGSLAMVCRELAVWFYWIEGYRWPDKRERIADLLLRFVQDHHNDYSSRGPNHREIPRQIRRIIKSAGKQTPDSKYKFAETRGKWERQEYRRYGSIRIEPIIMGAYIDNQVPTANSNTVRSKCGVKDGRLPAEMESYLTRFARSEGMRMRGGVYPLVRFARPFLSVLWEHQGSARINRDACLEMSGSQDPHLQSRYKQYLVKAGLLEPGWERTVRRYQCAASYRLTDRALEMFRTAAQQATGS
jgi:hypothetical protein